MDDDQVALAPAIRCWVGASLGAPILHAALLSGGNRHATWSVELADGDAAVLRIGAADDTHGPSPLQREAAAYAALSATNVPTPHLLACDRIDGNDVLLAERLPGETALPPPGSARTEVLSGLVCDLAALHALDLRALELGQIATAGAPPGLGRRAAVLAELDDWEARYRATRRLDPLVECGLAWCRRTVPADQRPAVLVHGDVGPGNFLHDGARVTGFVDWELCHLGDPLEDLAGFSLRAVHARVDGVGELLDVYATAVAEALQPVRFAWHQVLASLRVVILRHVAPAVEADVKQADRMISRVLHRRLLVDALHHATGRPVPPPLAAPQTPGAHSELFEAAAEILRDRVLPHTDPVGEGAVKAVARIVKHLAEVDRLGAVAEAAVTASYGSVLGSDPPDTVDGCRAAVAGALRAGRLDPLDALPAVAVDAAWETALLRPAMGALADRPLEMLELT